MNTTLFSTIHFPGQAQAEVMAGDIADWKLRAEASLSGLDEVFVALDDIFLVERGGESINIPGVPVINARIPDGKPYHCKDWSYGVAAFHCGLHHAMQGNPDLIVFQFTDCVLGCQLHEISREFMARPEVIAGPGWYGRIDTHLMLIKPEAVNDILYSVPFIPLCKTGGNALYYEEALTLVFNGRWWNPWPGIKTIRQEIGTPELFRGPDNEILGWPILAKASPDIQAQYLAAHPLPLFAPQENYAAPKAAQEQAQNEISIDATGAP